MTVLATSKFCKSELLKLKNISLVDVDFADEAEKAIQFQPRETEMLMIHYMDNYENTMQASHASVTRKYF